MTPPEWTAGGTYWCLPNKTGTKRVFVFRNPKDPLILYAHEGGNTLYLAAPFPEEPVFDAAKVETLGLTVTSHPSTNLSGFCASVEEFYNMKMKEDQNEHPLAD